MVIVHLHLLKNIGSCKKSNIRLALQLIIIHCTLFSRFGYNVHTMPVDIIQFMGMIQAIKITLARDLLRATQENYMHVPVISVF